MDIEESYIKTIIQELKISQMAYLAEINGVHPEDDEWNLQHYNKCGDVIDYLTNAITKDMNHYKNLFLKV
jgi:hypothetical protein